MVEEIDRLLEEHTYSEIAAILNEQGLRSGQGNDFDGHRIKKIRRAYKLKDRRTRLEEKGFLTLEEVATKLNLSPRAVKLRRAAQKLPIDCVKLTDKGDYMYVDPDPPKQDESGASVTKGTRSAV